MNTQKLVRDIENRWSGHADDPAVLRMVMRFARSDIGVLRGIIEEQQALLDALGAQPAASNVGDVVIVPLAAVEAAEQPAAEDRGRENAPAVDAAALARIDGIRQRWAATSAGNDVAYLCRLIENLVGRGDR